MMMETFKAGFEIVQATGGRGGCRHGSSLFDPGLEGLHFLDKAVVNHKRRVGIIVGIIVQIGRNVGCSGSGGGGRRGRW